MMQDWSPEERLLLTNLDSLFDDAAIRARIDVIAAGVEAKLNGNPDAVLAWETVPLETYGQPLDDSVKSSWVFILRAGTSTGAERHPNSIQRVMSYRRSGDFRVMDDGRQWTSHVLSSDRLGPIDERWVSIPELTWHEPVVTGEHWIVVSFHTVAAEELIEERPDSQRVYAQHEI